MAILGHLQFNCFKDALLIEKTAGIVTGRKRVKRSTWERIATLSVLLLLEACTTFGGHTQRMKIATEPEGAEIIYNGKDMGKTPAFVDIRRAKESYITLEHPGYATLNRGLSSTYRWGDSFAANFAWFFWGQPVASTIDLLTDTCWEYDRLGVIPLGTSTFIPPKLRPEIIAIAPPDARFELLSDEIGLRLQKDAASRFPGSQIFPFGQTHSIFQSYSYTNSDKPDADNIDNLYDHLKATHVLASEVQKEKDGVSVKTTLVDIYTDQRTPAFTEYIPSSELKNSEASAKNFVAGLLDSVPNLFTIDLDTPSSNIDIETASGTNTFLGVSNPSNDFIQYMSTLGIRSVRPPKVVHGVKGVFRFVPALTFTYDQFQFVNSVNGGANPFSGYTFDWYTFYAGFGPEGGLDTNIGYFYLDLIPAYALNWITGSGNGQQSSVRTTDFTLDAELGYQMFASSRINIRLFVRSLNVPNDAFNNLLPGLTGQSVSVSSATRNLAGLSVGYYFPETRDFVKRLLF